MNYRTKPIPGVAFKTQDCDELIASFGEKPPEKERKAMIETLRSEKEKFMSYEHERAKRSPDKGTGRAHLH